MADTRQRVLDTARALFNEQGLDRVGVRDIARAAEMSPGNLAYHFPTKDDLVAALVQELHDLDARTLFAELPPALSLALLYQTARAVMRNILAYRFVLLSYADAVRASPALRTQALALKERRRARHDRLLESLIAGGHLERRSLARSPHLFEQAELLSSGWLTAAAVEGRKDDEAIIRHYAKVGISLLRPHCTPQGAREMARILAGDLDEPRPPRGGRP